MGTAHRRRLEQVASASRTDAGSPRKADIRLSLPRSSIPDDTDAVCSGLGNPHFVLATEYLAHVGARAITRKALETFLHGIEAQYRIGTPLRYPHAIILIHPYRIGMRLWAGRLPFLPGFCPCLEECQVA